MPQRKPAPIPTRPPVMYHVRPNPDDAHAVCGQVIGPKVGGWIHRAATAGQLARLTLREGDIRCATCTVVTVRVGG